MDEHSIGAWNDDPLYDKAVMTAKARGRISISRLQLDFKIGYNRAFRLIEQMEKNGVVSVVADPSGGYWKLNA